MYVYYGSISWQILGIFLAAGFLIATLPFVIPCDSSGACGAFLFSTNIHWFGVFSEATAFVIVVSGVGFWRRNQHLAEIWIQNWIQNRQQVALDSYYGDLECWLLAIENQSKVNRQLGLQKKQGLTGRHFAILLIIMALIYTLSLLVYSISLLLIG